MARQASLNWSLAICSIAAAHIAVQASIISGTVTPARDGARYMTYALRLEEEPWKQVLRTSVDHPGYPVFISCALAAGRVAGIESPRARIVVAQAATSLAGLAFLLLSFSVLRRLWGTIAAWAATFSLAVLPRPAWTFADILSDPLHAALWMAAVLAFLRGLETRRAVPFLLAGALTGAAYWVRVDAVALAAAALSTLVLVAPARGWGPRLDRTSVVTSGAYAAGFGASLLLFVSACGTLSPKPVSGIFLLGSAVPPLPLGPMLEAGAGIDLLSLTRDLWRVFSHLVQEVQVVHVVTAAIGLATARRLLPRSQTIFILAQLLLDGLALLAVSTKGGYFSGRYFLPILPFVMGFGMAGVLRLSLIWADRRRAAGRWVARHPGRIGIAVAVIVSLGASLPSLLGRRLHDNEQGAVLAAEWVAARATATDTVYEPRFFPAFLASIPARKVEDAVPGERTGRHYAILEEADAAGLVDLAGAVRDGHARVVASFPRKMDGTGGAVNVYELAP